jgi:hypothetical protein
MGQMCHEKGSETQLREAVSEPLAVTPLLLTLV